MKVVLDTNVVVSGLLSRGGNCARILRLTLTGLLDPCLDDRILAEYEAVLPRPLFKIAPEDVEEVIELFRTHAERVVAPPLPAKLPDASDLPFLEVAAAAEAVLVTGNLKHFPRRACGGVPVMSSAEFLDLIGRERARVE